jgi:hypothetical protein
LITASNSRINAGADAINFFFLTESIFSNVFAINDSLKWPNIRRTQKQKSPFSEEDDLRSLYIKEIFRAFFRSRLNFTGFSYLNGVRIGFFLADSPENLSLWPVMSIQYEGNQSLMAFIFPE